MKVFRIKKNKDIKEVEYFGFEKRYNIYTGELDKYVKLNEVEIDIKTRKVKAIWACGEMVEDTYGEAIYDLTKADMLEKCEE